MASRCAGRRRGRRPLRRGGYGALLAAGAILLVGGAGARPTAAFQVGKALRLSGFVRYETFGYPDDQHAEANWENFVEARLRGTGRLHPTVSYRFEARAVADDVHFTAGGWSWRNESMARPYLNLVYGTIDYQPTAALRVSVGKQIVNWSSFDELQPASLLAPWDQSDIFRRVQLGVYGVSAHAEHAAVYGDVAVVPLGFASSQTAQGRWDLVRGRDAEARRGVTPVQPDETQVGARLGAHLGGLDAALIGYVGRDVFPIYISELIFVGGTQRFKAVIHDHAPRLYAGGLTATYPLTEEVLLRSEVVSFTSPDRDRNDYLQSAIGAEYAVGSWRVLVNYLRTDRTDTADEEVVDQGMRSFFLSFGFGEVRYDADGRLIVRVPGGYDFTGQFAFTQPEVSYPVWGNLRAALTADLIFANKYSYFDRIKHEDRLSTRLEYFF